MNTPQAARESQTTEKKKKIRATLVPDIFFDVCLSDLTGNEAKVLFYIIRRTCGFDKQEDTISLKQFRLGIQTREGVQCDKGCGIKHNRLILVALRSLEAKGYISTQKRKTTIGDDDVTLYRLHVPEEHAPQESNNGVAPDNKDITTSNNGRYSESQPVITSSNEGVVTSGNPQETVLQETVKQQTEIQNTFAPTEQNAEPLASADAFATQQEATSFFENSLFPDLLPSQEAQEQLSLKEKKAEEKAQEEARLELHRAIYNTIVARRGRELAGNKVGMERKAINEMIKQGFTVAIVERDYDYLANEHWRYSQLENKYNISAQTILSEHGAIEAIINDPQYQAKEKTQPAVTQAPPSRMRAMSPTAAKTPEEGLAMILVPEHIRQRNKERLFERARAAGLAI